jgi:hypothetical protein
LTFPAAGTAALDSGTLARLALPSNLSAFTKPAQRVRYIPAEVPMLILGRVSAGNVT